FTIKYLPKSTITSIQEAKCDSVDRYFIMKNFVPHRHVGWRVIKSTCVLIFIVCLVNTHYFYILGVNMTLRIPIQNKYKNSSNETHHVTTRFVCIASVEFKKFFGLYLPIFDLLSVAIIPFLLMIFTNIGIIRTTKHTSILFTSRKQKRNNRLTVMLLSVILAFMLLTCPSVIYICINRITRLTSPGIFSDRKLVIIDLLESLWYTKHALNFILYTLSGQDFRREFRKLISCSKRTTSNTLRYQRRQRQQHQHKESNRASMHTYNSSRRSPSINTHLHKLKKKQQYYKGNNQSTMAYSKATQNKIIDDGESTLAGECGLFSATSNVVSPTTPW
ncbi:unnamed protein product, partial [Rotaria sp. Silwood2]